MLLDHEHQRTFASFDRDGAGLGRRGEGTLGRVLAELGFAHLQRQCSNSGPLSPNTGSRAGSGTRATAAALLLGRANGGMQVSGCAPRGYAPTTPTAPFADSLLCPVPAGSTTT